MDDANTIKQLAKQLDELALLFAEFAFQCEYDALVLESKIANTRNTSYSVVKSE